MTILNQHYEFLIGDGALIKLLGSQEYSPGSTHPCSVWRFEVPPELQIKLPNKSEYSSFDGALSAIASAFFGGDKVKASMAIEKQK